MDPVPRIPPIGASWRIFEGVTSRRILKDKGSGEPRKKRGKRCTENGGQLCGLFRSNKFGIDFMYELLLYFWYENSHISPKQSI